MGRKVLVTGATGYIGGSVAVKLEQAGYHVTGLTRTVAGAEKLKELGISPYLGTLDDYESLIRAANEADIIINAADSDHIFAVSTILSALEGTGKIFIHTSGSSVVGDKAAGKISSLVFHEETIEPRLEKLARVTIDRTVVSSANRGVHSVVICPTLIYGEGHGIHKDSIQVPWLIDLALEHGAALHIGKGENVWSNVHIDDLVELYLLALEKAQAGSFFFAENGEASMKSVCESINRAFALGLKTKTMSLDEAIRRWGPEAAHFAFGSNSRVSSTKARRMLDWKPKGISLLDEIENGYYKNKYKRE
ncbi:NAD-dependent epimerase/dehydratase family protein [Paenibacillus alkalitolerans]|uniref:NAD-dependent epimerase/dehydratase family protein n=1 Tax=Paenibacillus alkalitolerans TaxID=2799335 RepID=UPI0018F417F8|nr:NAD-dependent epimerase/dehydratase family protein [Paenibacillus alkalitolerans]